MRSMHLFLQCPIFILLYINNLPKNILRSLLNIYAYYTMVYECTSTNLDNQSLCSDWALTIQCGGGNYLVKYKYFINQFCNVPSSLSTPWIFCNKRVFSQRYSLPLMPIGTHWDHKWNLYIWPIAKDGGKIVVSLYCSSKYLTPYLCIMVNEVSYFLFIVLFISSLLCK